MRLAWRLFLILVAALAVITYFVRYGARERAEAPDPRGLPARLLAAGGYDVCLWIPHPHQNLGELASAIGSWQGYTDAFARVGGSNDPPNPRAFGPFAVPPSSEIVACGDLDGRRLRVLARVYPEVAVVARLAGRMVGNAWLSGGEIGEADRNPDRNLRVAWRDGLWTVATGTESPIPDAAAPSLPPSLALAHLAHDTFDAPAGTYRLRRQDDGFELALLGGAEPPAPPALGQPEPALFAAVGPAWPDEAERPLPPAAVVLYETSGETPGHVGGTLGALLHELPGIAVFHPPGAERWPLPGPPGLVAHALPTADTGGWTVLALDDETLQHAKALTAALTALSPPDAAGSDHHLILDATLHPRAALALVTRLRKALQKIPLVQRAQVQRWRDWETLLTPFTACRQIDLAAAAGPSAFRLRLAGCGGG